MPIAVAAAGPTGRAARDQEQAAEDGHADHLAELDVVVTRPLAAVDVGGTSTRMLVSNSANAPPIPTPNSSRPAAIKTLSWRPANTSAVTT